MCIPGLTPDARSTARGAARPAPRTAAPTDRPVGAVAPQEPAADVRQARSASRVTVTEGRA
ncbi:hypothetical protein J2S48_000134 [Promicromonospora iranensis]|uniref:Uncharacterized protein n=1 Tax=Promicromonospora iranensis TaxID=1105144 RepID=A0ABU2CH05_9MICO|nr:hypothetical protein [Promicromonospora iranensis]